MSARLSVTVITSVLTRLNAATATISVRMMNIMRFSSCTAANQVRFCLVQSRTTRSPLTLRASCAPTWRAWCRSLSRIRTPLGPSSRKIRAASSRCSSASAESYSKCPESKVATTFICFRRGTTPAGVTCALGAISVTRSPSRTPSERASSDPSTMPNSPATSRSSARPLSAAPRSVTSPSCAGSMPRTTLPFISSPRASNACAAMNGATPSTCGLRRTSAMVCSGAGSATPPAAKISMCEITDSIRSVTSFWKPFITLSTTISAATPSAMPNIETAEMKEMKPLRRVARPARV